MSRYDLTDNDVRFLLQKLGSLGPTCGALHPYMRWACTLAKGHEGRCAKGPILFPEPEPAALMAPFVCGDELPPMPTWRELHVARVHRLHEIYQREMFRGGDPCP